MLKNFRKKVKQWFEQEDRTSQITNNNKWEEIKRSDHGVDTRVSYQYPTKRSFPFPLDKDNEPTIRRAVRTNERSTNIPDKSPNIVEQPFVFEKPERSQPFRASDVPSPVYGFQQRRMTVDLEEIPAFIRKENREESFMMHHEENITISANEEIETEEKIWSDQEVQVDNRLPAVLANKEELESNANHSNEMITDEQSVTTRQKDMEPGYKQVTKKDPQEIKKDPFNVRMRPSDKKRFYQTNQDRKKIDHTRPQLHLLDDTNEKTTYDEAWIKEQGEQLKHTLEQFQVRANVINAMQGPSVTRFEIQPESGVKVSKIKNLSDDIKLNMAAKDIRIEAPIPGKNAIGIEIPNKTSQAVGLQEIFKSNAFRMAASSLSVGLGLDITGRTVVTDIKKMPHGLIAGATGSGKSVCINSILISLLYKANPSDVRLLLIDPKMVELAPYNEIPHLVSPVITDVKAATHALKWAVEEMEDRYKRFVESSTRDIERYNQKVEHAGDKMPYLVIVIDELADLMMAAPQDVEDSICRIAQKARACGIHLLLATQRPSVDVITGLIKANIPTRIAFSVSSQVDSRTIIDTNGAERLLGRGDMLFVENGARTPLRIQGAFVSDDEIERVTNFVRKTAPTNYLFEQEQLLQQMEEENEDELYPEALAFVLENNSASTSLLQRQFKIGYNRAARLIDSLEQNQVISGQNGSKARTVLMRNEEVIR
ncbi:S-DNA-T family DNA segregation ATPase FtsK/SpoIIIE [Natronobacillus azotifigens]|uniref:DNA translocase FtsK n=1 Tax=Natronobacillus azotifigens TaxID=472978 RepID=A0A9J6RDH0_9BACI|nr:DNA translocase FtsK [Natronobacillus azotifigens]MCZ0703241.1 DNA translocase FtsK [Natronobacillus azotifigens]